MEKHALTAAALLWIASTAWATNTTWQSLIKEDCSPTMRGSLSRMTDERAFWVRVHLEMRDWVAEQRAVGGPDLCRAEYQGQSRAEDLHQCINRFRVQYDWFNRCLPSVQMMCRRAGGFCGQ